MPRHATWALLCAMWLGGFATATSAAGQHVWNCTPRYPLYGVGPCWCKDDYCAKPVPGRPPTPCRWLCDDYCPVPYPLPPKRECRGCCDDYLPKPAVCPPSHCSPWPCFPACGKEPPYKR